jgi:hypothetical protein
MRLLSCALITTLLTLTSVYSYQPRLRARTLVVTPSNVLSDVAERKQQQPSLTASQLAQYANELVQKRGFDYDFDVCDAVPRGLRTEAPTWTVRNTLLLSNGQKLNVEFAVGNPNEPDLLCGECSTQIPSVQVTKHELRLVADGKQYRVRRPATFILDEAELVDASMKKVLRTWQLPYQTVPIGISADGAKLYLYIYQFELDDLVLELSENGKVAFRVRAEIGLRDEGEWIENLPTHAAKTKLGFRRYQAGNKNYIVRFIPPCT